MKEFFKGVMHMTIEEMKEKKREHGYTYNMMSQMSGVPLGTVQKIFTGETKSPRYDTLEALARIFENGDRDYLYADMVEDSGTAYAAKVQGQYTLDDYYALPEDRRVELIDGCIYDMAAPSTIHQLIAGEVHRQISNFILEHDGPCMPFISPVDVQLDCDDKTMVEPDVIILCDRSKDINRCTYGAPDFVAEVLSKSTRRKDIGVKTYKYANAGVREYWMIDPKDMKVIVYTFAQNDDAEDTVSIFGFQDKIPVGIYNGELKIDFAKISKRLEANN